MPNFDVLPTSLLMPLRRISPTAGHQRLFSQGVIDAVAPSCYFFLQASTLRFSHEAQEGCLFFLPLQVVFPLPLAKCLNETPVNRTNEAQEYIHTILIKPLYTQSLRYCPANSLDLQLSGINFRSQAPTSKKLFISVDRCLGHCCADQTWLTLIVLEYLKVSSRPRAPRMCQTSGFVVPSTRISY